MGSLRVLSGEEACSILAAHGFKKIRWSLSLDTRLSSDKLGY